MRRNKLRELLKEERPTVGASVSCPWPGIVEILGRTGVFDYIEFEGEYMSWDLNNLENLARATELFDISSMMKIDQEPRCFIAQRSLGTGIQNVLFADVRTVEDARQCVRIVKPETPEKKGLLGCHARRSVGYFLEAESPAAIQTADDAVIAFMVEKRETVENLEEILSVKGLDMIQFGPCDLSISMGVPGIPIHPKVKEAELKTIKASVNIGLRPRVELPYGYSLDDVRKYMDLGVRDFNLPMDLAVLYSWLKKSGEGLRKVLIKT